MAKLPDEVLREIIKSTVIETVLELRKNGLLKRSDDVAYAEISERLYEYYQKPEYDEQMAEALEKIKGDYYFDILPQYYKSKITIDWIADAYHCEVSTISRNKKRLCMRLFRLLM